MGAEDATRERERERERNKYKMSLQCIEEWGEQNGFTVAILDLV